MCIRDSIIIYLQQIHCILPSFSFDQENTDFMVFPPGGWREPHSLVFVDQPDMRRSHEEGK